MWPIKIKINSIDNFKTQAGGLHCACFTHLSEIYLLPRALHQFIDVYLLLLDKASSQLLLDKKTGVVFPSQ